MRHQSVQVALKQWLTIRTVIQAGLLVWLACLIMLIPSMNALPMPAGVPAPAIRTPYFPTGTTVPSTAKQEPVPMTRPIPTDECVPATSASSKRHFRAVWIASVLNLDWPSRAGLDIANQQQEFRTLLDQVEQMRMNAIIVQIKPVADAFYPSRYGPWSQYLTGVQGKNPGYDPLAFMLAETHRRNLEFHAWFNPYRVSMQNDPARLAADHPARQHPDWLVSYGNKLYYNPGIPEVRQFVVESVLEVVERYDIDGVHMDDYFYPYPVAGQDFPDDETYQRYGGDFTDKKDWRRDNVNTLIQELSQSIRQRKNFVRFGISPFGVWRNASVDPSGSETQALANYDDLYADTRTWIRKGWLDYIAPQIYWERGHPQAAYDTLLPWWVREVANSKVQLYIGLAAYKVPDWGKKDELLQQLALNGQYTEVQGSIFFSLKDLLKNPHGIKDKLSSEVYKQIALVPTHPAAPAGSLDSPQLATVKKVERGVEVRWTASGNEAMYYAVYRFGKDGARSQCDFADSTHLRATIRAGEQLSWLDIGVEAGQSYTYYVTALDRWHRESRAGNGLMVVG